MNKFVLAVSFFVCLTFIHFVSDWVFQSHSEAMIKHNHFWIRSKHCAIYTACFIPFLYWFGYSFNQMLASAAVLFITHNLEDTYFPVLLWAQFIRRPPEMSVENKVDGFIEFNKTTLGKILSIVIDQLIHISFLWIVAIIYFL